MNPPHTGQSLSLETCLRRYADKLPIRVQVTSGYFPPDDDEGGVLNSGEIFDLKGLVLGEVRFFPDARCEMCQSRVSIARPPHHGTTSPRTPLFQYAQKRGKAVIASFKYQPLETQCLTM